MLGLSVTEGGKYGSHGESCRERCIYLSGVYGMGGMGELGHK